MHRVVLALATVCATVHAWSIKDRGAGIDSVETTFQTRLKGGGKGVTLTYVLAACGDEVGELEEDVREDEGAKYLDATELHAAAFGGRADCCEKLVARGDAVDARASGGCDHDGRAGRRADDARASGADEQGEASATGVGGGFEADTTRTRDDGGDVRRRGRLDG